MALLVDPCPIIQDGTARVDEARRLEHSLTQQTIRRGPRIKDVEHRRPRQCEAVARIHATYPVLGPLHRLKEDRRMLIHPPDLKAATAQRNLRRWRPALLAHLQLGQPFTNGYIEGCHTKITSQKRQSNGFRNRDRHRRKMLLASVRRSRSHRV